MSINDDEAQSPETGASSSNDPPPQLQSESADDEDELLATRSKKGYRRPRVEWREVLSSSSCEVRSGNYVRVSDEA